MLAVLLALALMVADQRYQGLQALRSILAGATYPLLMLANLPSNAGNWVSDIIQTREQLQSDNERLQRENLLLQARQQKMLALENENARLRNLLESSINIGDRVLVAELISVDLDPYRQQVKINKGRSSGVFAGQAVLDAKAVMGQVIGVGRFSATVLMITDASHSLPVQVVRNGLRAIADGTGTINELELDNLPNNADIQVGDELVTSGLGGRFPAGYPVGRVSEVLRQPGQPFARVLATPSAHLDRTREVLLVWPLSAPQPDTEDKAGSKSDAEPSGGASAITENPGTQP